jgi:hypothetical protein
MREWRKWEFFREARKEDRAERENFGVVTIGFVRGPIIANGFEALPKQIST